MMVWLLVKNKAAFPVAPLRLSVSRDALSDSFSPTCECRSETGLLHPSRPRLFSSVGGYSRDGEEPVCDWFSLGHSAQTLHLPQIAWIAVRGSSADAETRVGHQRPGRDLHRPQRVGLRRAGRRRLGSGAAAVVPHLQTPQDLTEHSRRKGHYTSHPDNHSTGRGSPLTLPASQRTNTGSADQ